MERAICCGSLTSLDINLATEEEHCAAVKLDNN